MRRLSSLSLIAIVGLTTLSCGGRATPDESSGLTVRMKEVPPVTVTQTTTSTTTVTNSQTGTDLATGTRTSAGP